MSFLIMFSWEFLHMMVNRTGNVFHRLFFAYHAGCRSKRWSNPSTVIRFTADRFIFRFVGLLVILSQLS